MLKLHKSHSHCLLPGGDFERITIKAEHIITLDWSVDVSL